MTTTEEQSSKDTQAEVLRDLGAPEGIIEQTNALYDSVERLSEEQKMLLVHAVLFKVSQMLDVIGNPQTQEGVRSSYTSIGHVLVALAGYATEKYRDEKGWTSTGDSRVEQVLTDSKALLATFAESQMSEAQMELSARISEKVNARTAKGETFEAAMQAELQAHRAEREALEGSETTGAETPSRYNDSGMYL